MKLNKCVCFFVLVAISLVVLVACDDLNAPGATVFSNTTWKKEVKNHSDSVVYTMYVKFGKGADGVFTAEPVNTSETVIPDNFTYSIENDTVQFVDEKYAYFHYYRWKLDNAVLKEEYGRQYLLVFYQYFDQGNWIIRWDEFEQVK